MLRMIFETDTLGSPSRIPVTYAVRRITPDVIHSSNLCTDHPQHQSRRNRCSIRFGGPRLPPRRRWQPHHEKLRDTISIAVRALDNVIDINFYPTEAAELQQSPPSVGLGVMGLQNALFRKGIPFASDAAVGANMNSWKRSPTMPTRHPQALAAEHGTYSTYKGSKWDRGLMPQDTLDLLQEEREEVKVPRAGKMDWKPCARKLPSRECATPTSSPLPPLPRSPISWAPRPVLAAYKNLREEQSSGDFIVLNGHLVRDLKDRGLWNDEVLINSVDGELDSIERTPRTCATNTRPPSRSNTNTSLTLPPADRNGSTNHNRLILPRAAGHQDPLTCTATPGIRV